MEDYEVKVNENEKRNEKFINEFKLWLKEKGLVEKTIKKHISNITFYLNEYLNYYDIKSMEEGISLAYDFLNEWFIRKCLWASKSSIKENASSIKKFYQCMSEKGYVKEEDYKELCRDIKFGMDEFLDTLEAFDNGTFYDFM